MYKCEKVELCKYERGITVLIDMNVLYNYRCLKQSFIHFISSVFLRSQTTVNLR